MKLIILAFSLLLLSGCSAQNPGDHNAEIPYVDTGINSDSWVVIPAGDFLKGQHNHPMKVDYDYEIMVTDVTNRQYARYLNEALISGSVKIVDNQIVGYYPGDKFDGYNHEVEITAGDWLHHPINQPGSRLLYDEGKFAVVKGFENHPVVMITWFGAKAYADFYGWRLPTEIEWEKAARGADARVYPWGNEIARNQANFYSSKNLLSKVFGSRILTTPVGYYNGRTYDGYETVDSKSPYGLYDMAGNVWQWTGDDYPYLHLRYMRGGSEANYEYNLRTWARNSAGPDFQGINIGFRCARDAVIAAPEIIEAEDQ